jgi:hypothetical protein
VPGTAHPAGLGAQQDLRIAPAVVVAGAPSTTTGSMRFLPSSTSKIEKRSTPNFVRCCMTCDRPLVHLGLGLVLLNGLLEAGAVHQLVDDARGLLHQVAAGLAVVAG